MPRKSAAKRTAGKNICFVTGTRAEFGLMRSVLQSIQKNSNLRLQIVVTGMHLGLRMGERWSRFSARGGRSIVLSIGLKAIHKLQPQSRPARRWHHLPPYIRI